MVRAPSSIVPSAPASEKAVIALADEGGGAPPPAEHAASRMTASGPILAVFKDSLRCEGGRRPALDDPQSCPAAAMRPFVTPRRHYALLAGRRAARARARASLPPCRRSTSAG